MNLHVTFNPCKNPVNYLIIASVLPKKQNKTKLKKIKSNRLSFPTSEKNKTKKTHKNKN